MKTEMKQVLGKFSEQWRTPSNECSPDFPMTFNTTTDLFNIYWLVKLIEQKVQSAKEEINQIRIGNLQFLNKNPSENNRTRKAACSRGTMYIFESRQDQARAITKNIKDSEEYSMALTDYVLKIVTSSNDKFFAISNELAEIKSIRKETTKNQNKIWNVIRHNSKKP